MSARRADTGPLGWLIVLFLGFSVCLGATCISVETDQIRASDAAKADAAFLSLPPDLFLTYAPSPGRQRIITAAEFARWQSTNHLASQFQGEVCFERASQFLNPTIVSETIRATLSPQFPEIQLKVIDVCPCSPPPGRVDFPLSGAATPSLDRPDMPIIWRGQVTGQEGKSYPIWARVILTIPTTLVRAKRNLQLGQLIAESDVEEVAGKASPLLMPSPEKKESFTGKVLLRSVSANQLLLGAMVASASAVRKGSVVEIAVINGPMVIKLQAKAESNADLGEEAAFTNPIGLRRFTAKVTGPGRAEIRIGSDTSHDKPENIEHPTPTSSRGIF